MRAPSYTHQFRKDVRRMLKQGQDAVKIKTAMTALVEEEPLAESFRDHPLAGSFKDRRACHLEADWLLVYKLAGDEIVFERTGTPIGLRLPVQPASVEWAVRMRHDVIWEIPALLKASPCRLSVEVVHILERHGA